MTDLLASLSEAIANSALREFVIHALRNVPGLPPIVQAVHIVAVAVVMGSIVFVNLRLLGLAVPSQQPSEMIRRLVPWTWWALPFLFTSGIVFVIARPVRYFFNPVAGIKFSLLLGALVLTAALHLLSRTEPGYWELTARRRGSARAMAAVSILLWLGVMMAGRWIAYADYLFWPEA